MAEMNYYIIETSEDGDVSIRKMSREALCMVLEEEINDGCEPPRAKEVAKGFTDLREKDGRIIIKGIEITLKPKDVVKSYTFE